MIWPFLILSYCSLFVLGFSDNIRGPLFPKMLNEFGLSDGAGSWVFTLSSMLAFFGSFAAVRAFKHLRKLHVLAASLLLMSLGMLVMAEASSYAILLAGTSLFGFALGGMGVVQNTLVTLAAPDHLRTRVLSGLHSMYGLASLTAPTLVAAWLIQGGQWQQIFYFAAGGALVVFIGTILWKGPEGKPEKRLGPSAPSQPGESLAAFILGAYVLAEIMVSSRLALFITRYLNQSVEEASLMVTFFFILLLSGRMLMAFIQLPFSVSSQMKASLISSLVLVLLGISGWVYGLVLAGLTMAPFYPLIMTYISKKFHRSLESAISKAMAAQSLLVVLMHFLVGYLSDFFGLAAALAVGPFFLAASLGALFILERRLP